MVEEAIIVGGGIGGLCTAIALRRQGIKVTVYEQAAQLGRVGAGLTLWANAIKALDKLGVASPVIKAGAPIEKGQFLTSRGQVLSHTQTGELSQRFGAPTIAIHRADLHEILLAALDENWIQLGARCTHFVQDEAGVTAHFANGRSHRADLLIGADGIHSAVRQQLFPHLTPRYAGYTAWRGIAAMDQEKVKANISFESWGCGERFGLLRINRHHVYWFATANMPAGSDRNAPKKAVQKQNLLNRFRHWHAPIANVLEATPADAILHNDIYDLPPSQPWSRGRVVLLGDAAHATTPNMGQGACQAIESAVVLAQCLAQESTLESSLHHYEAQRAPRTTQITQQSWRIGRIAQVQNKIGCTLRNWVTRLTPTSVTMKQLAKVAGYEV